MLHLKKERKIYLINRESFCEQTQQSADVSIRGAGCVCSILIFIASFYLSISWDRNSQVRVLTCIISQTSAETQSSQRERLTHITIYAVKNIANSSLKCGGLFWPHSQRSWWLMLGFLADITLGPVVFRAAAKGYSRIFCCLAFVLLTKLKISQYMRGVIQFCPHNNMYINIFPPH